MHGAKKQELCKNNRPVGTNFRIFLTKDKKGAAAAEYLDGKVKK